MKLKPILTLIAFLFSLAASGQDTLIFSNNYKYKFGVKLIAESSADYRSSPNSSPVVCAGLQLSKRIKNTKSSLETGMYFNTKVRDYVAEIYVPWAAVPYYAYNPYKVYYHYLSIPINYRIDTKSVYISGGIFWDYLLYRQLDDGIEFYINEDENYGKDRKFLFGYNLNMGIEKPVTKHLNIFAEIRYAVTVSSAKTDGGFFINSGHFGSSNLNYGFSLGVNYKFLPAVRDLSTTQVGL